VQIDVGTFDLNFASDFFASAAFLLKNRKDAIFCKVSRKKATHLEKESEQNV
jgi:hypothetical protein